MIERLLERAATRFVFVVGKGGVGKSTTASAFALALADRSQTTHLISTDPAHSLADVFHQEISSGASTPSRCNQRLTLEEFAARPYADDFFRDLRAPLIDLIERGTYLDTTDAAGFLDLSIPGIDEVMGALRLVDLHEGTAQRIVVDTAPTGHTMRLLDAAKTIQNWVAAGRAMAEKAGTVAAYLVGRRVPAAAEPLLDRLDLQAQLFDDALLRSSCAVVVTRAGDVVAAETKTLIEYLQQHGIAVGATIGDAAAGAQFTAPMLSDARGCDGLRAWSSQLRLTEAAAVQQKVTAARHRHSQAVPRWLRSHRQKLMLVAGKGGVGKSTCAAAIATALAEDRKVCVVSTDPAGSLSQIFARDVGSDVAEISATLYARQVDAIGEFQRMRERYRDHVTEVLGRVGLDVSLRLDRAVIESLWDFAPPGIDELIALIDILERADDHDVLVIDSAPTGHFLRLLELPALALDWVHALLRLLVKYSALGSLDALARDLLGFAKNLRQLQLDLSAPERAAVFVVTLGQPVVAAETTRLYSALAKTRLPVAATILNRTVAASPELENSPMLIAPEMAAEIVGVAALNAFVEQWEIRGE